MKIAETIGVKMIGLDHFHNFVYVIKDPDFLSKLNEI